MKQSYIPLLFILTFLIPAENIYSQAIDLSMLEGITKQIDDQSGNNDVIDSPDDQSINKFQRNVPEEYDDNKYGYQGSRDFQTVSRPKKFEKPLKYFGYNFFNSGPLSYSENNIPVPSEYVIGPGDNVLLMLYGNNNSKYSLQVNREGSILIPQIGPVPVAGLRFDQMKKNLDSLFSNQLIGTQVNISLGALRSINIFVLGDAANPGMYTVNALSKLTNAIFQSGGVKQSGSLRNIQLKRNGNIVSEFDVYDLLLNGDTSSDSRLLPGDVIFIPPVMKTVAIKGEVQREAIYELKDNENLDDLIRFSGGFTPIADLSTIEVERISLDGRAGFSLEKVNYESSMNDFQVRNGDALNIYPVTESMSNAILITGHSLEPGFYPWLQGAKVSDFLGNPDELLANTDLKYSLIKRKDEFNQGFELLQFSLESIINNKDNTDITLKDKDEIILFPNYLTLDSVKAERLKADQLSDDQKNVIATQEIQAREREIMLMNPNAMYQRQNLEGEPVNELSNLDDSESKNNSTAFYNYSIFDYCDIPPELGRQIVERGTFLGAEEFSSLSDAVENQSIQNTDTKRPERQITNLCRRQLLKPLIDLANRDGKTGQLKNVVTIHGNVYYPGEYPLVSNMTLQNLIDSAGGLQQDSYSSDIELIRINIDGKEINYERKGLIQSTANLSERKLRASDIVNVKKMSKIVEMVEVEGEVFLPGEYPISKNESLRDLLKRAGGLNDKAYPKAAIFLRRSLAEAELQRFSKAQSELKRKILLASQTSAVGQTAFDPSYIAQLDNLLSQEASSDNVIGRLVIDLEAILSGKDEDIILENGDRIIIPQEQQTISVIGEVFAPNAHLFKQKSSIDYYVDQSGGATEFADISSRYIIKADGSIIPPNQISGGGFFRGGRLELEPGDTIVLPIRVATFSGLAATTEISEIVYQLAIAAAAVNSFN